MATPSEPSVSKSLFEFALEEYEKETGIDLLKHPLAIRLERCNSVDTLTQAVEEEAQAFLEFRGDNNKVMTLLKNVLPVIHKLSSTVVLGEAIGLICRIPVDESCVFSFLTRFRQTPPFARMTHTSIGVLLSVRISAFPNYESL